MSRHKVRLTTWVSESARENRKIKSRLSLDCVRDARLTVVRSYLLLILKTAVYPSWICEIRIFLTAGAVKRPILHQRTKFRNDRSNRCGDIAIFVIFNIASAAIMNFQKLEILTTFPL